MPAYNRKRHPVMEWVVFADRNSPDEIWMHCRKCRGETTGESERVTLYSDHEEIVLRDDAAVAFWEEFYNALENEDEVIRLTVSDPEYYSGYRRYR